MKRKNTTPKLHALNIKVRQKNKRNKKGEKKL